MAEQEDPRRDDEAADDTPAREGEPKPQASAKDEDRPAPDCAEACGKPSPDAGENSGDSAEDANGRHGSDGAVAPRTARTGEDEETGETAEAGEEAPAASGRDDARETADEGGGPAGSGASEESGPDAESDAPEEGGAAEAGDATEDAGTAATGASSSRPASSVDGSASRRPMPPEGGVPPVHGQRQASRAESAASEGAEGSAAPEEPADDTPEPSAESSEATGRQRLAAGLWPPRLTRSQLIAGVLLFVLGLGLAIQVRSTSDNSALRGARQDDLVRILDELDNRSQRLTDEQRSLENQRTQLENSSDQAEEARKQTVEKEQQLGVLAGTVAAEGPGITLTVKDPRHGVQADKLLDTVEELRAAGAEAIQVGDVRVVAHSYFADAQGGVELDGKKLTQPYRFRVIGNPKDLEPALNIPGGVVQTLEKGQATVDVVSQKKLTVDALRQAKRPDYARSSSQ